MVSFGRRAFGPRAEPDGALRLDDGSRVAVMGGGPAGSMFASFLLDFCSMVGKDVRLDIYEPRDFSTVGPKACNMCGGIISETLVQNLAVDGVALPDTVVQRGIDSYVLHMDNRRVRIETPLMEKRIGTVHRGAGPRGLETPIWESFDGHLLAIASGKGASTIRQKVTSVERVANGFRVGTQQGLSDPYDLLVVATGINSPALGMFESLDLEYRPPRSVKTFIREYRLGAAVIEEHLGSSMHVFLLDLPGLEFAALIPKGEYVTMCLLGEKIDKTLLNAFLGSPEVRSCMPEDWSPDSNACQCSPSMVVQGSVSGCNDRIVFIGDCGVTRLYKDGIGAAYRTAKAAARTAVFHGISAADFRRHFLPLCRSIERDNRVGKFIFAVTGLIQRARVARMAVLKNIVQEQSRKDIPRRMSMVLWDMFTGSADYRDILLRTLHPMFLIRLVLSATRSAPAAAVADGAKPLAAAGSAEENPS